MPQLNPNPWFLILSSAWLIYTLLLQPNIMSYMSMNKPTNKNKITNTNPWTWPWT
uniref:ATP synthase complex subunit 8 n=1 Tax=Chelydra serpentina TaxID=8475 RepID=Q20FE9_CHESE|nr:ATP synthase F0 subunit 8 [Chelydra serpentina]ABB22869.1 ATP synthase F0 subunit 8 [Chelydra serpentina]ABK81682.1 ATPase subunit 8 [Chelydra serpentina]